MVVGCGQGGKDREPPITRDGDGLTRLVLVLSAGGVFLCSDGADGLVVPSDVRTDYGRGHCCPAILLMARDKPLVENRKTGFLGVTDLNFDLGRLGLLAS